MNKFILAAGILLASIAAKAEVYVGYGQWTNLPNCGGSTRLICDDVNNARQRGLCKIQFNGVRCQYVKLYVGSDYYPTMNTSNFGIGREFYVDESKFPGGTFRVFVHDTQYGENTKFEQIRYQFSY